MESTSRWVLIVTNQRMWPKLKKISQKKCKKKLILKNLKKKFLTIQMMIQFVIQDVPNDIHVNNGYDVLSYLLHHDTAIDGDY